HAGAHRPHHGCDRRDRLRDRPVAGTPRRRRDHYWSRRGPGEDAVLGIRCESGPGSVEFIQADHSTVGGNELLAEQLREAVTALDVLVNNVGGLYATRWETADGYEATLAMDVVGPFALTSALLPLLE